MRRASYEIHSCTVSPDSESFSVDGKIYISKQAAEQAADNWEAEYGEDCYVVEL